jgi:hypothetical protein
MAARSSRSGASSLRHRSSSPHAEAVGEHLAEQLDAERKQSREEQAAEVRKLNAESRQLFAIVTELQTTVRDLGRIDRAKRR